MQVKLQSPKEGRIKELFTPAIMPLVALILFFGVYYCVNQHSLFLDLKLLAISMPPVVVGILFVLCFISPLVLYCAWVVSLFIDVKTMKYKRNLNEFNSITFNENEVIFHKKVKGKVYSITYSYSAIDSVGIKFDTEHFHHYKQYQDDNIDTATLSFYLPKSHKTIDLTMYVYNKLYVIFEMCHYFEQIKNFSYKINNDVDLSQQEQVVDYMTQIKNVYRIAVN